MAGKARLDGEFCMVWTDEKSERDRIYDAAARQWPVEKSKLYIKRKQADCSASKPVSPLLFILVHSPPEIPHWLHFTGLDDEI